MSDLFDRYFLVLAGRLSGADCGAVATVSAPAVGAVNLGWPLDLPGHSDEGLARAGAVRASQPDGSSS